MLNRETMTTWAEALAAFVNESDKNKQLKKLLGRDKRSAYYLRSLRAETLAHIRQLWRRKPKSLSGLHYMFVGLNGCLTYDPDNRIVLTRASVENLDALIAITLAELRASKAPAEIRKCAFCECDRLFVRKRGRGAGRGGRLKEFCGERHAGAWRKHRNANCSKCLKRRTRR